MNGSPIYWPKEDDEYSTITITRAPPGSEAGRMLKVLDFSLEVKASDSDLFKTYDINEDGKLELSEFETLADSAFRGNTYDDITDYYKYGHVKAADG